MTEQAPPEPIEFVRLEGRAVRVTSWVAEPGEGGFRLIAITRGSRDTEALDELLARGDISLELPGQEAMPVRAENVDRRSFGEGQAAITRFDIALRRLPGGEQGPEAERPPLTLEERLATLERDVAAIRNLLASLSAGIAETLNDRSQRPES